MDNPALHIIRKCGGVRAVAKMAGINVCAVYRWTYPRTRRGSGGMVPTKHQRTLVLAARVRGITLTAEDFFIDPDPLAAPGLRDMSVVPATALDSSTAPMSSVDEVGR